MTMNVQALQIKFPAAERANSGDAKLYSFAEVPSMDQADEDYVLFLTVRAADTDQERLIADTCTRAITQAPKALAAMQAAYAKLDSVAFVSEEGDTDDVKAALLDAMAALVAAQGKIPRNARSFANRGAEDVKRRGFRVHENDGMAS